MNPVAPVTKYVMAVSLSQARGRQAYMPLYAGAVSATALAGGEPGRSLGGHAEGLQTRPGLDRQRRVERQPEGLDRGAAVREHRHLGEGGERFGVLERAL